MPSERKALPLTMTDAPVLIGPHRLPGLLGVPVQARALVIFAHGSGSSRLSPRNRQVAAALQAHGLATLLFDLLEPAEPGIDGADRRRVFDIPRLARRLTEAIDWAQAQQALAALPVGLFGASTGAAAALLASALRRDRVFAVVSRGGRPDLAHRALSAVTVPTLLIVGGADPDVIDLNEQAMARLRAPARLKLVPGATHLFEEPGALTRVAEMAARWFLDHAPAGRQAGTHPDCDAQAHTAADRGDRPPASCGRAAHASRG